MIIDNETERYILAACTEGTAYLGEAISELAASDFYQKEHKAIFDAMAAMYRDGQEVTAQTFYFKHGDMVKSMGISWTKFTDVFTNQAAFKAAIQKLKETAKTRELLALSDTIRHDIENGDTATEIKAKIEIALAKCESSAGRDYISPKEMSRKCLDVVAERMEPEERNRKCIYTGFGTLNRATGGFENGDLIILSGSTGGGKSAFAANIARDICVMQKLPGLYINSEMSADQMALRWSAILGEMSHTALRNGSIQQSNFSKLPLRLDAFDSGGLHTLTIPDLRVDTVLSEVRRFKAKEGIRLAIIDYIGRCDFLDSKNKDDWQLLTGAARRLKTLAQEQQIAIIMLAQLSASGRLAQASYMSHEADLWLNLRKPNEDETKAFLGGKLPWNLILEIVKGRNAPTGIIPLFFFGDRLTFTDDKEKALYYSKLVQAAG